MRIFAFAADVAMGTIVGIFLFAVLTRFWPRTSSIPAAVIVIAASILVVLFRTPGGSLASRRDRH
jgi:hypothetical protein